MNEWIERNRVPILLNAAIVSCITLAWIVYAMFGHALVESMYKGESIGFLNAIIEGQETQSLAEYFQDADKTMRVISLWVLAAGLVAAALIRADKRVRRNFVGATLLVLSSLTVSLVAAEWCVRYVFRDITTTGDNGSYFALKWMAAHPPAKNHWGFREREFPNEHPEGVYRIAVIGDSFTWGQGIPEGDRVTNVLEQRLNKSTKRFEVLNFGRCGAETVDELGFLRDAVLKVSPDYVLLQWYLNDVETDHSKRPTGWPLPLPQSLARRLHRSSALFYLIEDRWWSMQTMLGVGESYEHYLRARFLGGDNPDSRAAYGRLTTLIAETQARGIPIGIVAYPDPSHDPGPDDSNALGFLIDRVMETCSKSHIACLDLRPTFVTVRPALRLRVNRFDGHPNRLANELAADAILKQFQQKWTTVAASLLTAGGESAPGDDREPSLGDRGFDTGRVISVGASRQGASGQIVTNEATDGSTGRDGDHGRRARQVPARGRCAGGRRARHALRQLRPRENRDEKSRSGKD